MPSARRIPTAFALDLNYAGKAEDGKKVFDIDAGCAACHSLGGARKIGPDLSKIGAKFGKQAMLDNIVNPNDAIQFEYIQTTFTMANGEQLLGLVAGESGGQITLRVARPATHHPQRRRQVAPGEPRVDRCPRDCSTRCRCSRSRILLEYLATLK